MKKFLLHQKSRKLRLLTALAILPLFFFGLCMLSAKKTFAFSTTTPIQASFPATNSANIYGSGNNIQPWAAVGIGQYYGPHSYAKVYLPVTANSSGELVNVAATLTISQGAGVCPIDVVSGTGTNPNVDYEVWDMTDQEYWLGTGNFPKAYPAGWISPIANSLSGGSGCGAEQISIKAGTALASQIPGHNNYAVFYFEADMNNPCSGPNRSSNTSPDTEKNFRLSISNGGLIGASSHLHTYLNNDFGIYMRDAPSRGGNNWDYAVQFAPRCTQDVTPQPETVGIYDIDAGVPQYSQPNLSAQVLKDNRASPVYNWVTPPSGGPFPSSRPPWTSYGNSGTSDNLSYTSSNANRYLLEFRDVDWHNTIQVDLPYDQFDTQPSVGQNCNPTPAAICTATPSNPNPNVGQAITMKVVVKNSSGSGGPTFPTTYQLRQISVAGSPAGGAKNLTTSLTPGQTDNNIAPFNINGRGPPPQAVTFYYELFDGSSANSNAIPQMCSATVVWGSGSNPNFSINCSQTVVSGLSSSAVYDHTVVTTQSYQTNTPPPWFNPPPNNPGGQYTYTYQVTTVTHPG